MDGKPLILNDTQKFIMEQKNRKINIFFKYKSCIFVALFCFVDYSFSHYNRDSINSSINYINLAINIDKNYIYPAIVYLTSLLDNRAKSTFYYVNVLTNGKFR